MEAGQEFTVNSTDARTYHATSRATFKEQLEGMTDHVRSARLLMAAANDIKRERMAGTGKVHGAPTRFDALLKKADDALDAAFDRLEKATAGTIQNVETINGVAETIEKSNAAMADKLNQTTNGGPPLDGSSTG